MEFGLRQRTKRYCGRGKGSSLWGNSRTGPRNSTGTKPLTRISGEKRASWVLWGSLFPKNMKGPVTVFLEHSSDHRRILGRGPGDRPGRVVLYFRCRDTDAVWYRRAETAGAAETGLRRGGAGDGYHRTRCGERPHGRHHQCGQGRRQIGSSTAARYLPQTEIWPIT